MCLTLNSEIFDLKPQTLTTRTKHTPKPVQTPAMDISLIMGSAGFISSTV